MACELIVVDERDKPIVYPAYITYAVKMFRKDDIVMKPVRCTSDDEALKQMKSLSKWCLKRYAEYPTIDIKMVRRNGGRV